MPRNATLLLLILAALLVVAAVAGCGQRDTAPVGSDTRLVLIGLDGAEWDLIHPMIAAGEMPHLAGLMERGVHGKLRSLEPPQKSPAIWTTIATGKSPTEHGIRSFVDKVAGKPLTKNMRRVRALWSILSGVGRTTGVVGWLMSWPAEEVNGFIVSDYLQYDAGKERRLNGRTYPAELETALDPLVVRWPEVPWSFVQQFLDEPLDTTSVSSATEALLRPIRWIAAGDMTFTRVGAKLYAEQQPDFFAVYLRGMDAMGHLYWNYMIPETVPEDLLSPEGRRYLGGSVRAYYRYTDQLLGELLAEIDDQTTVMVVSDHGFKGGTGRGVGMHKDDGIFVLAGPGVGRGEITGANVYDIAPTVLVLMGLPPAKDMPGKVLWPALDPARYPPEKFTQLIATYETGERGPDGAPLESPVDEELKERLRALGYID